MANPSGPPTAFDAITVLGVPTMGTSGLPLTNGNYWFVDSATGSDGNSGTANNPFATTTQALSKCVAANGDVIVLAPNHAETISTAAGIAISVSGVSIIGLGNGNDRPVWTFATSAAATVTITAANVTISNIVATTTVDQIVSPFVVSAADCTLNITWLDGAANKEALRAILTTAAANRLNVNLRYIGFTTGSHGVNAIRLVGGRDARIIVDYYGICTTAVVEFLTTAVVDCNVSGYFYVSGITNFSRAVVDTVTGSTWSVTQAYDGAAGLSFDGGSGKALAGNDVSTVVAGQAVPAPDSTANVLERDVIGNKTDAVLTAVGTTKSLAAYVKTLLQNLGFLADAAVYFPGSASIQAYIKGNADLQENVAVSGAAVMSNNLVVFNIAGGPLEILALESICQTANDATASTLQWTATGTLGATSATITGATATLANAVIGTNVAAQLTALATAPVINANGVNILATPGGIVIPAGTLKLTIGVGSTTGTWKHYLRYRPLATGVSVTAAF